jgi:hypothetical protein
MSGAERLREIADTIDRQVDRNLLVDDGTASFLRELAQSFGSCRPDCKDGAEDDGIAAVAAESFERRIAKLQFELEGRLTFEEARDRMLKEIEAARQGHVSGFGGVSISGDLFRGASEHAMKDGLQVLALPDFNAALDRAFPAPANQEPADAEGGEESD